DEFANAVAINARERILADDVQIVVGGQEAANVVTAHAERGLGEVVGAEAEELGLLGDLICTKSSARNLDHGAGHILEVDVLFFHDLLGDPVDDLRLVGQLGLEANEGYHHLYRDLYAFLAALSGSFEDGAALHLGDFRIGD